MSRGNIDRLFDVSAKPTRLYCKKTMEDKMKRNQKGFTLIEIIAVLVILGILAAVAIPKYFSLQDEARNKSAKAAVSEVQARASQLYGAKVLRSGSATTSSILASLDTGNMSPDYTVGAALSGSDIRITVTHVQGNALTTNVTGTWVKPN